MDDVRAAAVAGGSAVCRLLFLLFLVSIALVSAPPPPVRWDPLTADFAVPKERTYGGILASTLLGDQKLYVGITTIRSRLQHVVQTVRSILKGMVVPTHIYLFLSEEPYLLDKGVPKDAVPLELRYLASSTDIFSIVYTDNVGPHRKLLPLLHRHWDDDCVLVTFDDDKAVAKDALFKLISHYLDGRKAAIVGLRTRRIGLCASAVRNHAATTARAFSNSAASAAPKTIVPPTASWAPVGYGFCRWPRVQNERMEMLVLPTGNGGILYRPRFFHEVVFDPVLRDLTAFNDDLTFRLATLANRIPVLNGCCERLDGCLPPALNVSSSVAASDAWPTDAPRLHATAEALATQLSAANVSAYTDLYVRNEYLNTDMWAAGLAYLRKKGVLDLQDFLRQPFMVRERPDCFHVRKRASASASAGTETGTDRAHILKEKKKCGLFKSCVMT